MTDEEKKAYDNLIILKYFTQENEDKKAIQIILDLIEKQKEKIKNLEDELNKYIVKMSDEEYRRLVDIIRDETSKEWKDKIKAKIEEIEELKKYEKYYEEMEEVNKRFIAVDKIKAIQIIDLDGKIHNVYKIEEE